MAKFQRSKEICKFVETQQRACRICATCSYFAKILASETSAAKITTV